jgi:ABC-type transport system substrate-binding protein
MGRSTPQDPVVLAQLVQDQWRKGSQGVVNAELKLVETPEYQRLRAIRSYTYSVMTNTAGYVEPDGWFQQIYRTGASRNYWNNSDARLDSMIDRQRTIFNANERKALITEMVRYMIENSPGVTLAYHYYVNATGPKVRDFAPEVQPQGQQYEWVWQDA